MDMYEDLERRSVTVPVTGGVLVNVIADWFGIVCSNKTINDFHAAGDCLTIPGLVFLVSVLTE